MGLNWCCGLLIVLGIVICMHIPDAMVSLICAGLFVWFVLLVVCGFRWLVVLACVVFSLCLVCGWLVGCLFGWFTCLLGCCCVVGYDGVVEHVWCLLLH